MDLPHPCRSLDMGELRTSNVFANARPLTNAMTFCPSGIPCVSVVPVGKDLGHGNIVQQLPLQTERFFHVGQRGAHLRQMLARVPHLHDTSEGHRIEHACRHFRSPMLAARPPRYLASTSREFPCDHGTCQAPSYDDDACCHAVTPSSRPTFSKAARARSNWALVCAALSWTRMRASLLGTTG